MDDPPAPSLGSGLLDGRTRYRTAVIAGVDCPTRQYIGNDPITFVIDCNLKRRHLSERQRAMKLATLARGHRPSKAPIGVFTHGVCNVRQSSAMMARQN
jgi:hypothetical protein